MDRARGRRMDRRRLADRQIQLNRATEKSADRFAPHRRRVMALALGAERGPAAVLGAGNCNDLDLPSLAARFEEVHLLDLDGEALRGAVGRAPAEARARLVLHGGVDLSGIHDLLAGWDRRAPSAAEDEAAAKDTLPVAELGLCQTSCLLTQMILSIVDRLGSPHPRCVDLVRAVRTGHLLSVARSLRRDGLGVIVSDMVSSDTVPDLLATPPGAMRARMEALVRAGNFFTGANPYVIAASLQQQPEIAPLVRDVQLSEPWIWPIADLRGYLVFAVRFRRTDRAAP